MTSIRRPCGGCEGLGAHGKHCTRQPGSLWRMLGDKASELGDFIGSNDPEAANIAYGLAGRFAGRQRAARLEVDMTEPQTVMPVLAAMLHETADDWLARAEELRRNAAAINKAADDIEEM